MSKSHRTIRLFPKQEEFFKLNNRINVYYGGIQCAKTTTGGLKMVKFLPTFRDDDTFIIASDTYKTLTQATLPKFLQFAKGMGSYNAQRAEFQTNWGPIGYFRTATEPDSVEGITNCRRIWLDEGGKVSKYFFENLMGRAAFKEAPMDITTTPYSLNWLSALVKEAEKGLREDVSTIHCRSIDSPYFPVQEYERQKRILDPKRFAMKYDGFFGQMEGLVFPNIPRIQSFKLPTGTKYYGGVDWGYFPDPFCFVIRALTPDGKHYRVREYYRNFATVSDIVDVIDGLHQVYRFEYVFCDPSQPAHIDELCRYGIPAGPAENEIRYGIDKHYALIKEDKFFIFEDMNPVGITEYESYHYPELSELGFNDSYTKKQNLPVGQNDHGIDCDRYITVGLDPETGKKFKPGGAFEERPKEIDKKIEWLKRKSQKSYSGL